MRSRGVELVHDALDPAAVLAEPARTTERRRSPALGHTAEVVVAVVRAEGEDDDVRPLLSRSPPGSGRTSCRRRVARARYRLGSRRATMRIGAAGRHHPLDRAARAPRQASPRLPRAVADAPGRTSALAGSIGVGRWRRCAGASLDGLRRRYAPAPAGRPLSTGVRSIVVSIRSSSSRPSAALKARRGLSRRIVIAGADELIRDIQCDVTAQRLGLDHRHLAEAMGIEQGGEEERERGDDDAALRFGQGVRDSHQKRK